MHKRTSAVSRSVKSISRCLLTEKRDEMQMICGGVLMPPETRCGFVSLRYNAATFWPHTADPGAQPLASRSHQGRAAGANQENPTQTTKASGAPRVGCVI